MQPATGDGSWPYCNGTDQGMSSRAYGKLSTLTRPVLAGPATSAATMPQPPSASSASRVRGDDRTCDLEAEIDGRRAWRDDGARAEPIPPHRLHLKVVPRQADKLNPTLVREQLRLLALLQELVANPQFATFALIPVRILDHQHGADLMAQRLPGRASAPGRSTRSWCISRPSCLATGAVP
jgi:hypothetical protein